MGHNFQKKVIWWAFVILLIVLVFKKVHCTRGIIATDKLDKYKGASNKTKKKDILRMKRINAIQTKIKKHQKNVVNKDKKEKLMSKLKEQSNIYWSRGNVFIKRNTNSYDPMVEYDFVRSLTKIKNLHIHSMPREDNFLPSNRIAILYPNFIQQEDDPVGFGFFRVGKNYEFNLVYRNSSEKKVTFISFYNRFTHYSYFEKDFQYTQFFDRLLYSENSDKTQEWRKTISKFNLMLKTDYEYYRKSFVLYKIPLSHWNHPNNIKDKDFFIQETSNYISELKKYLDYKRMKKREKTNRKMRKILKKKDRKNGYEAHSEHSDENGYFHKRIEEFRRKERSKGTRDAEIKQRLDGLTIKSVLNDQVDEQISMSEKREAETQDSELQTFIEKKTEDIADLIDQQSKGKSQRNESQDSAGNQKKQILFSGGIISDQKGNLVNIPKSNLKSNKLKSGNIYSKKSRFKNRFKINTNPKNLISKQKIKEIEMLNKAKDQQEVSTAEQESEYFIKPVESNATLSRNQMNKLLDADEDHLQSSAKSKKESSVADNRKVSMEDVMDIFNNQLSQDVFLDPKFWNVENGVKLRMIFKGEFSLSNHILFFCFDSFFSTFLLILKDTNFQKHSKEIANFKTPFNQYVKEFAKREGINYLTRENSYNRIEFIHRYRHQDNSRILALIFFIPGFEKIFYVEVDLYSAAITKQSTISLGSFGAHFGKIRLKSITFHEDLYISMTLHKQFVLVPLSHFFEKLSKVRFPLFSFNMPFEIFEVHMFQDDLIGIIELDEELLKSILKKTFYFAYKFNPVRMSKLSITESKRKESNEKFIRNKRFKSFRVNETKLHMFSFRFNKLTLKVEKFFYEYSIPLEDCFPYQKEAYLNYLRKQSYYNDTIDPKNLSHLAKMLSSRAARSGRVPSDVHMRFEREWKETLKREVHQTKFFSSSREFYCLFQHKYYLKKQANDEHMKYLLSRCASNPRFPDQHEKPRR